MTRNVVTPLPSCPTRHHGMLPLEEILSLGDSGFSPSLVSVVFRKVIAASSLKSPVPFVFRHRGLVADFESTLLGRVDGEPRRAGGEGQITACLTKRHPGHAATLPAGSSTSPATLPRRVEIDD
jgi:hypothetical protein